MLGAACRLAAARRVLTVADLMLAALDPYASPRPPAGPFDVTVEAAASQALSSVDLWARERSEIPTVEHLIVVLVDQADPAAAAVLTSRGRDLAALRRDALARLGARPIRLLWRWQLCRSGQRGPAIGRRFP